MSKQAPETPPAVRPDRAARLKAALKANIAKRKAQARARAGSEAQDIGAEHAQQDGTHASGTHVPQARQEE